MRVGRATPTSTCWSLNLLGTQYHILSLSLGACLVPGDIVLQPSAGWPLSFQAGSRWGEVQHADTKPLLASSAITGSRGLTWCNAGRALVSSGRHNKAPHTGRLKQQTHIVPRPCRLEAQDAGVGRVCSFQGP